MANAHLPIARPARTVSAVSDNLVAVDLDFTVVAADVLDGPIADMAVDPTGSSLLASHFGRDSVSVIDPVTLTTRAVVALGGDPFAVAATQDHAYISTVSLRNPDALEVVNLDTKAVVASYPMSGTVSAVAASADGKRVFAASTGTDRADIAVIDTITEQVGHIEAGWGPAINIDALHVGDNGRRLYAAASDTRSSHLLVINAESARVDRAIGIGAPTRDIAVGPDETGYVLTSDRIRGGAVAVIDLASGRVRERVDIGGAPTQLVLSADGTRAFIVDYDSIVVLCTLTNEVVHVIDVDSAPACVVISPDGGRLFVADHTGVVTGLSVASTEPLLYSKFLATDPIPVAERVRRTPAKVA